MFDAVETFLRPPPTPPRRERVSTHKATKKCPNNFQGTAAEEPRLWESFLSKQLEINFGNYKIENPVFFLVSFCLEYKYPHFDHKFRFFCTGVTRCSFSSVNFAQKSCFEDQKGKNVISEIFFEKFHHSEKIYIDEVSVLITRKH